MTDQEQARKATGDALATLAMMRRFVEDNPPEEAFAVIEREQRAERVASFIRAGDDEAAIREIRGESDPDQRTPHE